MGAVGFDARTLCSYTLKPRELESFQRAIDEDYYFEFIYGADPPAAPPSTVALHQKT